MATSAEKSQLFNRVVFCGPSGARCGVCVTTALWVQGLDQAQTSRAIGQLEWLTNSAPQDAPIDPCVPSSVRRVHAYRRPGAWLSEDDDINELAVRTVNGLARSDLFILEQSSAVIAPTLANCLCATAKAGGATVVVRLHSQLLQGLSPTHVDLFVAPFALADANKLRDSEVRGVEPKRWAEIGHPCPHIVVRTSAIYVCADGAQIPMSALDPSTRDWLVYEALHSASWTAFQTRTAPCVVAMAKTAFGKAWWRDPLYRLQSDLVGQVGIMNAEMLGRVSDSFAALASPPSDSRPVYGLGARNKSAHRLVRGACERLGLVYETPDVDLRPWTSIAEYVERLSKAAVIVLYYLPLNGIGRSSALGCAVATGRPVIASDSVMLEDARAWNGVAIECDLDDALTRAVRRNGVATAAQDTYAAQHGPESSAMTLLQAARATRESLNVH